MSQQVAKHDVIMTGYEQIGYEYAGYDNPDQTGEMGIFFKGQHCANLKKKIRTNSINGLYFVKQPFFRVHDME